jgi:hypothetical protein
MLCLLVLSSNCSAQAIDDVRVWSDASGRFSVEAKFSRVDESFVWITRADGEGVKVARGLLSKDDQEFLTAAEIVAETQKQYNLLQSHLVNLSSDLRSVAEISSDLLNDYPAGVNAGIFLGVANALSGDSRDFTRAKRVFTANAKSLKTVYKQFPEPSRVSYASTLNNLAVLAIRGGSSAGGARMFAEAAEISERVPFVVYHNSTILLGSGLDLGSARSDLTSAISKGAADDQDRVEAKYLMYSLDHDTFGPEKNVWRHELLPDRTCFSCNGTALVDCPKCIRGKIKVSKRVHVATIELTGERIYAQKQFPQPCNSCDSEIGKIRCTRCGGDGKL